MKALIFSVVFALTLTGMISVNSSQLEVEKSNVAIIQCDNYWSEIVDIDGNLWLYEYCGDKLVQTTPIFDED